MKKIICAAFFTILFSSLLLEGNYGDDKAISANQLPQKSQDFIKTFFSNNSIKFSQMDIEDKDYKVLLDNNVDIEFDKDGNWENVENQDGETLPTAIINLLPKESLAYIKANYAKGKVVEIDNGSRPRENWDVKILIENHKKTELKFDKSGKILDIDKD